MILKVRDDPSLMRNCKLPHDGLELPAKAVCVCVYCRAHGDEAPDRMCKGPGNMRHVSHGV
jgi:hypothetical protein